MVADLRAQQDASKLKYELKKQLRRLQEAKGSGTELISVYIPAGAQIHDMSNKLKEELGQASNIKSKSTRKNVMDALERVLHYFKSFQRGVPENGIAIFAGNVSENPAKVDIELFSISPMQPIQIQLYRCDSRFFLEPLESMIEVKDSYGLVVLDGREATLAILRGTQVQIVKRMNSLAHAKIRKGGQSARRFERLIQESIEKYYIRVGEAMDLYFLTGMKGVIVGGPGPTKDFFMKMKPYNYQIKVLGIVDTGYVDEYGIRELMAKSGDIISEQEAVKEKRLIDRFIQEVVKGGLATYGEVEVRSALVRKQAEKLLVSEGLAYKRLTLKCQSCGDITGLTARDEDAGKGKQCEKCKGKLTIESEKLLIDDLIDIATENQIPVEVVSQNTTEGAQLLQSFYGIGAFLRYK